MNAGGWGQGPLWLGQEESRLVAPATRAKLPLYASFAEEAQLCFSAQRLISTPPAVRTCAHASDWHEQQWCVQLN
jgi:hypothetical protein